MIEALYTAEPCPPAGTPEWHELRKCGIGGSEAAAVCGVSKYKTALDIYMLKLGLTEPDAETNRAMRKGNALEPFIKSEYELETGFRGYKPEVMFRSVAYPWLFVNPDWIGAEGIEHGGEFKNSDNASLWGEAGTEDVPDDYWIQCQQGMLVTGKKLWHLYALLPRNETRLYPIAADADAQKAIVEKTGYFWREHVLKRVPPEFDSASLSDPMGAVRELYGAVNDQTVELASAVSLLCEQFEKADAEAKASEKEAKRLKAQLLSMVGDAGRGLIPGEWEIVRKLSPKRGHWVKPTETIKTTIKRLEA